MTHRYLFTSPPAVDWPKLDGELDQVIPGYRGANRVEAQVAVYSAEPLTSGDRLAASVTISNHTGPAPYPPLDTAGALATLLVVEGVLLLVDAANAIGEEPAHLEHEATAWSVG